MTYLRAVLTTWVLAFAVALFTCTTRPALAQAIHHIQNIQASDEGYKFMRPEEDSKILRPEENQKIIRPEEGSLFIEAFGGLNLQSMINDHAYDVGGGPVSPQGLNRYTTPSALYGVRAGFWHGAFGGEIEAMHAHPSIEQAFIESCDQQPNGDCLNPRRSLEAGRMLSVNSVAIHALLRYEGVKWQPFVGIGPAYLMATLQGDPCGFQPTPCGTVRSPYSDSTQKADAVGLSVKAGILYKVTDKWGLSLTYGFQQASFKFSGWVPQADASGHGETINPYLLQAVTMGVRYGF